MSSPLRSSHSFGSSGEVDTSRSSYPSESSPKVMTSIDCEASTSARVATGPPLSAIDTLTRASVRMWSISSGA